MKKSIRVRPYPAWKVRDVVLTKDGLATDVHARIAACQSMIATATEKDGETARYGREWQAICDAERELIILDTLLRVLAPLAQKRKCDMKHFQDTSFTKSPVDRSGWGLGPWMAEPDEDSFCTEAGLRGRLERHTLGFWCGYVAVHSDHPALRGEAAPLVHGGVTFVGEDVHGVWWIGFDAGHSREGERGDMEPGKRKGLRRGVYRDIAFMRAECERLANQLAGKT